MDWIRGAAKVFGRNTDALHGADNAGFVKNDKFEPNIAKASRVRKEEVPRFDYLKKEYQEHLERALKKGGGAAFRAFVFLRNKKKLGKLYSELKEKRQALNLDDNESRENATSTLQIYGEKLSRLWRSKAPQSKLERLQEFKKLIENFKNALGEKNKQYFDPEELELVTKLLEEQTQLVESSNRRFQYLESERANNEQKYQRHVELIRSAIKANNNEAFAKALNDLEIFDKQLKDLYQGRDPYPYEGIVSTVYEHVTDWGVVSTSKRPTISDLMIEHSLAKSGIDPKSSAYLEALKRLFQNIQQKKEGSVTGVLSSLWDIANNHPSIAVQMAGDIAHLVGLLSDNAGTSYGIQTGILRKARETFVRDLLMGSKEFSYGEEAKHPLSLEQIVLIDMLRKAPRLVGAVQGMLGQNIGGKAGLAAGAWFGPGASAVGGAAGGIMTVEAQRVLAESMSRDMAIWSSAVAMNPEVLELSGLYSSLSQALSQESWKRSMQAASSSVSTQLLPLLENNTQQGMIRGLGNVYQSYKKGGSGQAFSDIPERVFSKEVAGDVQKTFSKILISAYSISKFLDAFKIVPPERWPDTFYLGSIMTGIVKIDGYGDLAELVPIVGKPIKDLKDVSLTKFAFTSIRYSLDLLNAIFSISKAELLNILRGLEDDEEKLESLRKYFLEKLTNTTVEMATDFVPESEE